MASSFRLRVLSPSGQKVDKLVTSATVPSADGEVQFLPQHCEFVGLLKEGVISYDAESGGDKLPVTSGTIEYASDILTILTD